MCQRHKNVYLLKISKDPGLEGEDKTEKNILVFDCGGGTHDLSILTIDGVYQNPHLRNEVGRVREFIWSLYHSNYLLSIVILKFSQIFKKIFGDFLDVILLVS